MLKSYRHIYIGLLSVLIIVSYSIFYFMELETISVLTAEDGLFEYLTFFSFLFASIFFLRGYKKSKNLYLLLLAIVMFIGAGEEISWGQRILEFNTPEIIKKRNVQKEFNFHNLEAFNVLDFDDNKKQGFERLLEINFLFKLFCLIYCFIIPLFNLFFKNFSLFLKRIKMPVPSVIIGAFFPINWLIFRFSENYLNLPHDNFVHEVMECNAVFMLMIVAHSFYIQSLSVVNTK